MYDISLTELYQIRDINKKTRFKDDEITHIENNTRQRDIIAEYLWMYNSAI